MRLINMPVGTEKMRNQKNTSEGKIFACESDKPRLSLIHICKASSSSCICTRIRGSSAEKASSIRSTSGLLARARASPKMCIRDSYIKYLADARLINLVYPKGEEFPKKPSKIMMHNSNLMYSIYPCLLYTSRCV